MKIHSIETLGTHEGPGVRIVFFLQGCNLRCKYCHNPDTQSMCGGKDYSIEEMEKIVDNNKSYFRKKGGVTLSGGEPLLQAKEVSQFFKRLKEKGINTCIDTAGSIDITEEVKETLRYTDLILLDVKCINSDIHKEITSSPAEQTLNFAAYLEKENIAWWMRYVLVPTINDNKIYLEDLGKHFKNYKTLERVEIIPYHSLGEHKYKELGKKYEYSEINTPTQKEITSSIETLKKYFKDVRKR